MKHKLLSKWLIIPVVVVAMISAIILGVTNASFNDVETSNTNSTTAWTSANWTQTTLADFGAGVLSFAYPTAGGGAQLTLGPFALRGNSSNLTWAYSPAGGNWTAMAQTPGNPAAGGALAYDGGNYVYALQGGSTTFWRYDIANNTWSTMAVLPAASLLSLK